MISFLEKFQNKYKNIIFQTFFYGKGDWNENQKKWLEALKPIQEKLIVASLGHPLEEKFLPNAKIFNLGSFHRPMLKEFVSRLVNKKF